MPTNFRDWTPEEIKARAEGGELWQKLSRLDDYDLIAEGLEAFDVPDDPELAKQQLIKLREDLLNALHLFDRMNFD